MTRSTISCQLTPGGVLARKLEEVMNSNTRTRRLLVTDDGGLPVTSSLRRYDPFRRQECRYKDPTCIVDTIKDCAKTSVLYEITCKTCNLIIENKFLEANANFDIENYRQEIVVAEKGSE